MSDPRPPAAGAEDPAADPTPAPPPAGPAIDLSEPEPPEPSAPPPAWVETGAGPDDSRGDTATKGPAEAPPSPPAGEQGAAPLPPPAAGQDVDADAGADGVRSSSGGQAWKMALVVVVFLAVVVVAYVLGKSEGGKEPAATATSSTTINTAPVDTAGWTTVTDDQAGFTIRHPKDWESLPIQGAERLVLRVGPESAAQVTVRNIESSLAPSVIQQVMADAQLVADPREFDLNGLPAVVYIFNTPVSEDSPDPGVAVQYFVLSPKKMYTMVFVVRPPEELNRLGTTFSAVAASLKSTSDNPAPEPPAPAAETTPTTAAGTTSTTR